MSIGTSTAKESLPKESGMELSTKHQSFVMCVSSYTPVPLNNTGDLRTWLQAGSRASPSAEPAERGAQTMNEICGPQLSTASASYDPSTRTWKTLGALSTQDISEQSWETWPISGMTQGGVFYPQPKWGLRIKEIGSGSWPTPQARDWRRGYKERYEDKKRSNDLNDAVSPPKRWPTPTVQMTKPDMNRQNRPNSGGDDLGSLIKKLGGGLLNPDWTEWLIGWPIKWTSLDPLPTDNLGKWIELSSREDVTWWDEDPHETIPRITEDKTDRVKRLTAIGNGVVPLTAKRAWDILSKGLENK